MIPIQATVVGFTGRPCTLFSGYDPDSGVLAVSVEAEYRRERRDGCVIITNDPDMARDVLFTEDHLRDAISAFYALQGGVATDGKSTRLGFADKAGRANPSSAIEKDGLDERGPKYRLAEGISCAQVATLATAWYAVHRAGAVQRTLQMAETLATLAQGGILTI